MIVLPTKRFTFYLLLGVMCWLAGCKKDEEPKEKVAINTFSMQMNGQFWAPYQDKTDPCTSTFSGGYGTYGEMPYYFFYAYRDPNGRGDTKSENLLIMHIVNATKLGTYPLNGTYKNIFDAYIIFQADQLGGGFKQYVNDPLRKPFVVTVDEIPVKKGYTIPGIKGSFKGILYNEADPTDSLVIENGKFDYDIMTGGFNNHCGY